MAKDDLNRSPEEIEALITSPVLLTVYHYDTAFFGHSRGKSVEIGERSIQIEASRTKFVRFSEQHNLAAINTTQNLRSVIEKLATDLSRLSDEEVFNSFVEWREHEIAAHYFFDRANRYIRVQTILANVLGGKRIQDITDEDMQLIGDHWKDKEVVELELPFPSPHEVGFSRESIYLADQPINFIPRQGEPTAYQIEAEEFSRHKEATLVSIISRELIDRFADSIGRDALTDEPVIYNSSRVHTFEDAQRFSRELPVGLENWSTRGLESAIPGQYQLAAFFKDASSMAGVVSVILPDGTDNPAYQRYLLALTKYQDLEDERKQHPDNDEAYAAQRLAFWEQLGIEVWQLRRTIFPHIVHVFEGATQLVHPDIERNARKLAAYAISPGMGTELDDGYTVLNEERGKPLASLVDSLKQIAYKAGLYIDPKDLDETIEEIRKRSRLN